jgi:hypothetical protein
LHIRRKNSRQFYFGLLIASAILLAWAVRKPLLFYTPGEWDCACGDMYIKTTRFVLWNPFRDRTPESAAESFLAKLRDNNCSSGPEICAFSLPDHRVSNWKLAFREDAGQKVSCFFKLTKYGSGSESELQGVGVVDLKKVQGNWAVTGYDAHF